MGIQYKGINLSGLELGSGTTLWQDYTRPGQDDFSYWTNQVGANIIRLPFTWDRLQYELNGELEQSYLNLIKQSVAWAEENGSTIILDLHNFGFYNDATIGSHDLPITAFSDLWKKLGQEFQGNDNVWFNLMNEPYTFEAKEWADISQEVVNNIRDAGIDNKILLSGTAWSGAQSWEYSGNADAYKDFVDPLNNFAFDVHQYIDEWSTGNNETFHENVGIPRLEKITDWANDHDFKLFLGEIGITDQADYQQEVIKILDYMETHSEVWLGWTLWGAGPWWPNDYHFNINPQQDGQHDAAIDAMMDYFIINLNNLDETQLSPAPVIFDETAFTSYNYEQDVSGVVSTKNDGIEVTLSGNIWKKMAFEYVVTTDTIISFEYKSTIQAELQGFVLETDNNYKTGSNVIQLYGYDTTGYFDRTHNYSGTGGWQTFNIRASDYITGNVNALAFINDHDGGARNGNSTYRNFTIYEDVPVIDDNTILINTPMKDMINLSNLSQSVYDYGQHQNGGLSFNSEGDALTISGNTWQKLGYTYNVTEHTMVKFSFRSDDMGEIQGIGFENDNRHSTGPEKSFQLTGSQTNPHFYNDLSYTEFGNWQTFTIRLGDYQLGKITHLAFVNDDDADSSGISHYRDITLYEDDGLYVEGVYIGTDSNDVFDIDALPGYGNAYEINGFEIGKDKIDVSDLLESYDPLTDVISDFLRITNEGVNSLVEIDADGQANGSNFTQVATITNITNLTDELALEASGTIIA